MLLNLNGFDKGERCELPSFAVDCKEMAGIVFLSCRI